MIHKSASPMVVCPFCLGTLPFNPEQTNCPRCQYAIPANHIGQQVTAPPVVVELIGADSALLHHYMQAIITNLVALKKRYWQALDIQPQTQSMMDKVNNVATYQKNRQVASSQATMDMLLLRNMPRWRDRTLIVHYNTFDKIISEEGNDNLPKKQMIPLSILLLDLDSMMSVTGRLYKHITRVELGHQLVQFAQAQPFLLAFQLSPKSPLPPNFQNYVYGDTLWKANDDNTADLLSQPHLYLERMQNVSNYWLEWLAVQHVTQDFNQWMQSNLRDVSTSLLIWGHRQLSNDTYQFISFRLLDILFWAFEYHSASE